MPINIELPTSGTVGPGQLLRISTQVFGPFPTDTRWRLRIGTDPEGINPLFTITIPFDEVRIATTQLYNFNQGETVLQLPLSQPAHGQAVHVIAELVTDTGVMDSGAVTTTWDATSGLGAQIYASPSGQGGLTDQQAQQLANTDRRTQVLGEPTDLVVEGPSGPLPATLAQLFSRTTLDRLTLDEVTNGPTCEPVRAAFSFWYFGVIVRVTTIAEDLIGKTPDRQWYFPDLAVLRIFRGQDLQFRQGIHTPTYLTERAWEFHWNIRNTLDMLGVPPDNTLAVDWRQGCCGQVYFLRFQG